MLHLIGKANFQITGIIPNETSSKGVGFNSEITPSFILSAASRGLDLGKFYKEV